MHAGGTRIAVDVNVIIDSTMLRQQYQHARALSGSQKCLAEQILTHPPTLHQHHGLHRILAL